MKLVAFLGLAACANAFTPPALPVCGVADLFTGPLGQAVFTSIGDTTSTFNALNCAPIATALQDGTAGDLAMTSHNCCCILSITEDYSVFPDTCSLSSVAGAESMRSSVELCASIELELSPGESLLLKDDVCPMMAIPSGNADCDGRQLTYSDEFAHYAFGTFGDGVCATDTPTLASAYYGLGSYQDLLANPPSLAIFQPYTFDTSVAAGDTGNDKDSEGINGVDTLAGDLKWSKLRNMAEARGASVTGGLSTKDQKSHTAETNRLYQLVRPFNFNCMRFSYEGGDCLTDMDEGEGEGEG